jgi:hypothetical protein
VEGPGTTTEEVLNDTVAKYGLPWNVYTSKFDTAVDLSFAYGTLYELKPEYDPDNPPDPLLEEHFQPVSPAVPIHGMSSDHSALVGEALAYNLTDVEFFSGLINPATGRPYGLLSKEPLAPFTKEGDTHWSDLVRWVMYVLYEAEERGITQQNVMQNKYKDFGKFDIQESDPPVYIHTVLGLSESWAKDIIKAVGNYGEIYERNLKEDVWYPRGANSSWKDGGLMYAPAFR